MSDKELSVVGIACFVFAVAFLFTVWPGISLLFMAGMFACFFKLSVKKDGGDPPGPILPA